MRQISPNSAVVLVPPKGKAPLNVRSVFPNVCEILHIALYTASSLREKDWKIGNLLV
jgi:hypothetical protein